MATAVSLAFEEFALNLDKVPEKYRVANSTGEVLTVYRGDNCNLHGTGIPSRAYLSCDYERIYFVKRIIESGDEYKIQELIDSHTCSSQGSRLFPLGSPFISATLNPEFSQVFATRKNTTIYRLHIPANRAIADYGPEGKFGLAQEILVLGLIMPCEIASIKVINDDLHSELFDSRRSAVRYFPKKSSVTRDVKQPDNWKFIVSSP